jgi:glycogenin glucosyltransferase
MKKAFATYLCNDLFIPGAIALVNSLKANKSSYQAVCMVTDGVTPEGRQALLKSGYELADIERISPNRIVGIKDRYKDNSWMMFTKLNLWKQTQYDKLVFIDADCIALRNVDEMLDLPSVSAVRDLSYGGISAGVMVLTPDQELFEDMMKDIDKDVYDNTYSDQSFLNWYLKDRSLWNEIPLEYNVHQKRVALQEGVKIYHYNGQKPWIKDPDNICHWRMGSNQIFNLWQYFYNLY